MNYVGTSGNDSFLGTSGADTFDMTQGGDDVVAGGDGADVFSFGAAYTAADEVDGGAGDDIIKLNGDYSGANALHFTGNSFFNVEELSLAGGHSYTMTLNDGNLGSGQILRIVGASLGAADSLNVNGGAETDGRLYITGGAGDDVLSGGGGADIINAGAGDDSISSSDGHDHINLGDGNDFMTYSGNKLTAPVKIDGGAGNDSLTIIGDYSAGLRLSDTTITNIENLSFAGGVAHFVMADGNLAAGQTMVVSAINSTQLIFDATAEKDATSSYNVTGSAGNDSIALGAGNDAIFGSAGADRMSAGSGTNVFVMNGFFNGADRLAGGAGFDRVDLNGDYHTAVHMGSASLTAIDDMDFAAGNTYSLVENDANVASGARLMIDASDLASTDTVTFNGAAETNGAFDFTGGRADNNSFTGGAGSDTFAMNDGGSNLQGGVDLLKGGAGNDTFNVSGTFSVHDQIDGGTGSDTLTLTVPTDTPYHFTATTLTNVETIVLKSTADTGIITNDANVAAGQTLTMDGSALNGAVAGVTEHYSFDGAAETDGRFVLIGGAGNDSLEGGAGNDRITGGAGADDIQGRGGMNVFVYNAVGDSNGSFHDTITGADMLNDSFDLQVSVTAIDAAVTTGALSAASFDSNLATDLGSLGAHHAVVFTASSGDLAGHTYLVIDANGQAGYQGSQDMVIELVSTHHLANLAVTNFI
ncbi:MAG TPA: calcium-binding protein [Rhizomicrobium sp.]|jgi:Ca2+-binding RTX toxin-like protein